MKYNKIHFKIYFNKLIELFLISDIHVSLQAQISKHGQIISLNQRHPRIRARLHSNQR